LYRYAPFTYDAWNHPETLALISKVAGVDLVVQGDYEIAHINLSVKTDEQTREELSTINKQKRFFEADEGIGGCPWEDDKPIVGWHTDSYPFVCVLMLSDCTNMVGGETALRTGNGDILKVRGPQEVCLFLSYSLLKCSNSNVRVAPPYCRGDTSPIKHYVLLGLKSALPQ
jgi:hypothetical protein